MAQRKKPRTHKQIKGASGRGKSTFLRETVESATRRGMPLGIIRPSEKTVEGKRQRKPKARRKRRR